MADFRHLQIFIGILILPFQGNCLSATDNGTITKRSSELPQEATLGFVMREIGLVECMGIDHITGGNVYETILETSGHEIGGNYLCLPTCGGECVPNQDITGVPEGMASVYPFGCKCPVDRCDGEGPIVGGTSNGFFQIMCLPDTRCTCDGMGPSHHVGYLCSWMNVNSHRPVSFLDRPLRPDALPNYSPIRWCSCCPQIPAAPYARAEAPFYPPY